MFLLHLEAPKPCAIVLACTGSGAGCTTTVAAGETLDCVATRVGAAADALAALNPRLAGLAPSTPLRPGQQLAVPCAEGEDGPAEPAPMRRARALLAMNSWHLELLDLVNGARAQAGVPPLCLNAKLTAAAQVGRPAAAWWPGACAWPAARAEGRRRSGRPAASSAPPARQELPAIAGACSARRDRAPPPRLPPPPAPGHPQAHSADQAANGFYDHTGSDGSDIGDRVRRAGYEFSSCAENIHNIPHGVPEVFEGW